MELRRYGALVLAWWWLLLLATVLAAGAGYLVSRTIPKTYRATTTLLVNQAQTASGPDYNSLLMSERLATTYASLMTKSPVLDATIQKLGLATDEQKLAKKVSVSVVRNTQLLEVAVEDESPAAARDIANTLTQSFIAQRLADQSGQTNSSRATLQKQIADLDASIKTTSQQLEQAKDAPNGQAEVARLQGLLAQQQSTYSQLLKSELDLAMAESRANDALKIVVPAELPETPVRPNVLQNTALAAVVGLLLALGAVFLIEYLDDTVKSDADVQMATGLATLATIPRWRRKKGETTARLLDDEQAHSGVGEAFRALRVNVGFAWAGEPGRTIMFTSANPGEGKTTTVVNLARALVLDGRRVVVVDADLRRPSVHRALGMEGDHGLTNLLADPRARVEQYLQPTTLVGLRVLACGPIPPNPAELLGSARFSEVLTELGNHSDAVLVDAPPTLGIVDPAVIGTRVDGVIVIAEASGTRLGSLARAVAELERTGTRRLGVVLNKVGHRSHGYGYYYYYGNRGYYYRREEPVDLGSMNGAAAHALGGSGPKGAGQDLVKG